MGDLDTKIWRRQAGLIMPHWAGKLLRILSSISNSKNCISQAGGGHLGGGLASLWLPSRRNRCNCAIPPAHLPL